MKKIISKKEIQKEELEILKSVISFLNNNKLKYYLFGGSLLGAIRHKGFIPWDDDIDIAMPRKDYNKLQEIIKQRGINILDNNLYFHSIEQKNLCLPFSKVYNYNIEIYDWRYKNKFEKYLWIDIFPIDKIPNNKKVIKKICSKNIFYKKILLNKKKTYKYIIKNNKPIKAIIKVFIKSIISIIPSKLIAKRISKLSQKYLNKECNMSGNLVWGYGEKEVMDKEIFNKTDKIEFEGNIFNGLKEYDKYLTNIYKDYMKLPSKEKRITHNFKAWRVDYENYKK